jgi:Carboxypeptidase regulatory-like domain/TonB dependent receptor
MYPTAVGSTSRSVSRGAAILAVLVLSAPALHAESPAGGLLGWVEDAQGSPISGAMISLFGRGIGGAGLVTMTDSAGRFSLPSLPPGNYTVRALREGHTPAPARRVLILPNQDSTFTISMTPVGETPGRDGKDASAARESDASAARDLQWLIRHKRRSALEDRSGGAADAEGDRESDTAPTGLLASLLPDLAGTLQVVANPIGADVADDAEPGGWSVVKLNGRIADSGHWSLGGLVAERESATWRMAGEFVFEPGGGHAIEVSTGYGTRALRPLVGSDPTRLDRGVGAVSFQDRWQLSDRMATTFGGRYSYAGFLQQSNHLDRMFAVEFRSDENVRLRGMARSRTLVPGGDVLTVSNISTAPAVAFSMLDDNLRAERILHYEVAFDQEMGDFTLEGHAFYETIHDQLVNGFTASSVLPHALSVSNGGWMGTRGMGVKVSRRFGDVVQGSMTYTYGHSWRPETVASTPMLAFHEGDFHDLAARVETMIEGTDTRVVAFCRVNRMASSEMRAGSTTNTRFDVQLSQGLPFLGAITRADWDVLVAVRNLFYEASEAGVLDEMAVAHPPKRVLGGISVRF